MSEVVALLLDDAMPAERLGDLLRAARKRRGLSRKKASAIVGTTAAKLRRYERGEKAVPAEICARLAECYGDDLTAHVPLRVPPEISDREITVGGVQRAVGADASDVIAGFVDIVQRLRDAEPGEPLALRATDVVALAAALGEDHDEIERRIADALGCSRTVARKLHAELLRRKVIVPVAGLAAGIAAFSAAAYTTHAPASGARVETSTVDTMPTSVDHPTTTAPKPRPTTSTTAKQTPPTTTALVVVPPSAPAAAPTAAPHDEATAPADQQPSNVPATLAPPVPDPNDPPVSILPGETPITVIGTATQASEETTTP